MKFRTTFYREAENGGGGGSPATKTYDEAYVTGLRNEAKGYREEATAARARAEASDGALSKAGTDHAAALVAAQASVAEARAAANTATMQAALKVAAKDAGMIDLDGLKLLDISAVKVDDAGVVTIPDTFFADAKKAKSYLFTATGADTGNTTGTGKTPPVKEGGKPVSAMDMSDDDYKAARAAIVKAR